MRYLSRILLVLMALAAVLLFWPGARAQNTCSNCPVTEITTVLAQGAGILDVRTIARENGGQCDHYLVTVCDGGTGGACTGGTIRTFRTDDLEISALFAPGVRAEKARELVLMMLAYRRRAGLALTGPIQ